MPVKNKEKSGHATRKAVGYIAKLFRAVDIYMWPFAARWKKPFSWEGFKKRSVRTMRGITAFAGVLVLHQLFQAGTSLLFPTGQDFLRKEGLDPALATQLSDKKIRVRSRDFWGKAHALNDAPTILGIAVMGLVQSSPEQAYAIPNQIVPLHKLSTSFNVLNQCRVLLEDKEKTTAKDFVSFLTKIPKENIEHVPITDRESFLSVTFHEFAHCDSKNRDAGPLSEMDADSRGVWLAAQTLKNPEIIKVFLYARAMSTKSHGHDTALYLDAKIRNQPLPKELSPAFKRPTDDVFALVDLYKNNYRGADGKRVLAREKDTPDYIKKAMMLKAVLEHHSDLLSDLGKRRAELYIEAVKYFIPSSADQIDRKPVVPVLRPA